MKLQIKYNRELWIASIIAFLCITALFLRTERLTYSNPDFSKDWDHHAYIEMAANSPFDFHGAPFAWRILNPLLAKALPFDLMTNFTILNFLSLWLTGLFTYLLLRRAGFSNTLSITGLLFFTSLGWATRFYIWEFWCTDSLSFLFITASIWCIFAKRDVLFLLFLAVGVTAKESIIFVAPLYYTLNTKKFIDIKLILRTLYLSGPAILILIILRVTIIQLFEQIGLSRIKEFTTSDLLSFTITSFGISLVFLPIFSFKKNLLVFLRFLPFILLIYSSLLFATTTERLTVSAFPAVIIMALYGIKNIVQNTKIKEELYIFLPLSLLAMLLIKEDWHVVSYLVESFVLLIFLAISIQSKWKVISNKEYIG